ncbi:hypothetical protein [Alistipes finegoldii]|jgi:tetrahydromethanopterin S-methyltransferase subunit F|uniref:hypothetical protein n=1 Tax=Alistipes finegoldii TaxID=214856 RepID=UPI00267509EE|nr:hypothetical protein [Alistipes finegoldii]
MKANDMMSYEMYEDFKETMVKTIKTELSAKHNQPTNTDLSQRIEQIVHAEQERHRTIITQLAGRLENIEQSNAKTQNGIDNLQASVEAIEIPAELPPRIVQHKISLAIESKGIFWAMIGMMTAIVLLCTMLYWATKPNYDRIDNDLKYRYIKMKGEATPDRIAELEELFELNRDNSKIRQLKKYVEEYELIVKRKVQLEEQARLRIQELEKLKKRVDNIKNQ